MDSNTGKRISAFLKSKKLAIILIFIIILLSIIGTHIPQKSQLKPEVYNTWKNNHPEEAVIFEGIGFTNLFSSVIFLGILLLLFISTIFCIKTMLSSALRRLNSTSQFQSMAYIKELENNTVLMTRKAQNRAISEIDDVLRSNGYRVFHDKNRIFAQKARHGVLGIPLFHICILFIILASVYGSIGRMEGDMRLIEGQLLSEDHENYMFINEGPFFNENHKKFDITLEKFYPDYKDETGTPRGPAGKLSISENGKKMKTGVVYLNNLVDYDGYTFLGNVYGLAPLLILLNQDGTVFSGSYIAASDTDSSGRYTAYFDIGDTGIEGGLMVYMTANLTSEKITASQTEQVPVLFLKVFDRGKEIYDGTMRLNDTVKISDKYLGFYDIKYWSNFYVVKDDGTILVYTGIGLITFSLVMIFFIVPKRVYAEIIEEDDETKIYLGGRADKFRFLYKEEYCSLVNNIKERLSNGTD